MPEAPEIALTAEILCKYLCNNTLSKISFETGRYTKAPPVGYKEFQKLMDKKSMKLVKIDTVGKFIWFDFSYKEKDDIKHYYMWNTLGLTGLWTLYRPKTCRVKFVFRDSDDKKVCAYYSDSRNFGTFKFTDDKTALKKKVEGLKPDLLKDDFDLADIRKYKYPVVKILMDQDRVGSGLGNYLVAEALYRAKLNPHTLGSDLTDKQIEDLIYAIKYTTKLAYEHNEIGYMINLDKEGSKLKKQNYHPEIKLKKNDEFEFQVYRRKEDLLGNPVKGDTIIKGRTTYWVPKVQK